MGGGQALKNVEAEGRPLASDFLFVSKNSQTNPMKPKFKFTSFPRLFITLSVGFCPLVSYGQTLLWEGDQDANWNTDNSGDTNWSDNFTPQDEDVLSFGGVVNTATNNNIAAGLTLDGIIFSNDGTADTQDASFTLAGNSIGIGGNISTTATVEGATLEDIIALDLVQTQNFSILTRTGHGLNVTGDISSQGDFTLAFGDNANPCKRRTDHSLGKQHPVSVAIEPLSGGESRKRHRSGTCDSNDSSIDAFACRWC